MNRESEVQVKIRMPESLRWWLKVQAAENRRTLLREIEHRLIQSRQQQGAKA